MNSLLTIGTRVVVLALLAYSIAIITEQRKKRVTNIVLVFILSGIVLDITATIFMILGSSNSPFTLHGFLGYTALLAMLIDCTLLVKTRLRTPNSEVPRALHLYSRYAYIWWLIAFVTGGLIAMIK